MGLDFSWLVEGRVVTGIGGDQAEYTEPAEISFFHGAQVVTYNMPFDVAPVTQYNMGLPSLLGMDVLQHWRMVCDVHSGELEFTVHQADAIREMNTP